jgi:hypothetical protein
MQLTDYVYALIGTARSFAFAAAFVILSIAGMQVGYTDAMIFFGICGAIILVYSVKQYTAELQKQKVAN